MTDQLTLFEVKSVTEKIWPLEARSVSWFYPH